MSKVYIVTEGEYSNYHIVGVFSTLKAANDLLDMLDDAGIEEYELDEIKVDLSKKPYRISMLKESGEIKLCTTSCDYDTLKKIVLNGPEIFTQNWFWDYEDETFKHESCYVGYVMAKDEEHAKKIFIDEVAKLKAKEAGIV